MRIRRNNTPSQQVIESEIVVAIYKARLYRDILKNVDTKLYNNFIINC